MIKILKEGRLKTCTCDNCGCVFQFNKDEDVKIERKNQFNKFGRESIRKYIECPQCKTEIELSGIILS